MPRGTAPQDKDSEFHIFTTAAKVYGVPIRSHFYLVSIFKLLALPSLLRQ